MFVLFVFAMTLVVVMGTSEHVHQHPLHRRMMAHHPENVNWLETVPAEQFTEDGKLDTNPRTMRPDIACVPYASGREAKQTLRHHYEHV